MAVSLLLMASIWSGATTVAMSILPGDQFRAACGTFGHDAEDHAIIRRRAQRVVFVSFEHDPIVMHPLREPVRPCSDGMYGRLLLGHLLVRRPARDKHLGKQPDGNRVIFFDQERDRQLVVNARAQKTDRWQNKAGGVASEFQLRICCAIEGIGNVPGS